RLLADGGGFSHVCGRAVPIGADSVRFGQDRVQRQGLVVRRPVRESGGGAAIPVPIRQPLAYRRERGNAGVVVRDVRGGGELREAALCGVACTRRCVHPVLDGACGQEGRLTALCYS